MLTLLQTVAARKPTVPIPLRERCLEADGSVPMQHRGSVVVDQPTDAIDVAFYETRARFDASSMLNAASLINQSGASVRFHALLRYPRLISSLPGFQAHNLDALPAHARCLLTGLQLLAHGPGPQYLYKPLLHWVLPGMRRLILLDTDVVMVRPIAELFAEFERFDGALIGLANEQSLLYQKASNWTVVGKNGGVQLMELERMRQSRTYGLALDQFASGTKQQRLGFLGDQSLYSALAASHPPLFHTLGCEWNRQLSMQFGFHNSTVHSCPRRCGLLHANYQPAKCIARLMQTGPMCARWAAFSTQLTNKSSPTYGACPTKGLLPAYRRGFQDAIERFFWDCCIGTPEPLPLRPKKRIPPRRRPKEKGSSPNHSPS